MTLRKDLEAKMAEAVAVEDFEAAARLRDRIARLDPPRPMREVPGRMGLGTDQPLHVAPAGWKPPPKPDLMTTGASRRKTRR